MNENACDEMMERLVDYADGELLAADREVVAEHVKSCHQCRRTLVALERSIEVAGIIWQAGASELSGIRVPVVHDRSRFRWQKPVLVAASLLIVLTGSLMWHQFAHPRGSDVHAPTSLTFAQLEQAVNQAGVATQLLAAADYLAEQPGGAEIARDRFHYIVSAYPNTDAATQARLRLQSRSQRRT